MVDGCTNEVIKVTVTKKVIEERIWEQRFFGTLVNDEENYKDYWPASMDDIGFGHELSNLDDEGRDTEPLVTAVPLTIIHAKE